MHTGESGPRDYFHPADHRKGPNSLIISFSLAARMDFLRCNLSPLFFAYYYKRRSNEPDKHSDELNANKRVFLLHSIQKKTLLQWRMASADPPGIMFVGFFGEKCLLAIAICIIVIPARLHCVLIKSKKWGQTLRRCNGRAS